MIAVFSSDLTQSHLTGISKFHDREQNAASNGLTLK